MKRRYFLVFFALLLLIFNLSLAKAIINETKQVDNAYNWLENEVRNNWHNLKVLQHEVALLALAYNDNLKAQGLNMLRNRGYPQGNPYCWGETTANNENQCRIKETAIASYIYNEFGLDYSKINEWLLNKSSLFKDIQWYLQADIEREYNATCEIIYDNTITTFSIDENKNISILSSPSPSSCFSVFQNRWLKIDKNCYEKDFKISCNVSENKPFSISFLYKKDDRDSIWYVSDYFYQLDSGDYVDVSIRDISICLADQTTCEYEANAIAAYVLYVEGDERYKNILPFLILNAEDNNNKNSYAWLYLITRQSDYGEKVMESKQMQGFWKLSNFGQFYDTSINAYALIKENMDFNITKTKNYLLGSQKKEGFWLCVEMGCEKVRDTALILYVFWPKGVGIGPGGPGPGFNDCEQQGGSCEIACNEYNNFVEYPPLNYACGNFVCCMNALSLSCYEIGGDICEDNEDCVNGVAFSTQDAPDGKCCVNGTCQSASQTCAEQNGYICDYYNDEFCPSGKEIAATDLEYSEVCCAVQCKSCKDVGGEVCEDDYVCSGNEKGDCCFDKCIPRDCDVINAELCDKAGWRCVGTTEQSYEGICCRGDCVKSCDEEGGIICEKDQKCDGDEVDATDLKSGEVCCIGECKKKAGFPWFLIIIFLILIIAAILFFFYKKGIIKFKKKEIPKKPEIFMPERPMPMVKPTTPAKMPTKPEIKPTPTKPIPPKIVPRPLPTTLPKIMPKTLPKEEGKKEEKERKERKKGKTEEELEKTLKKIRELTK